MTVTKLATIPEASKQDEVGKGWADVILESYQKTITGIFETGQNLLKAKAELQRGEFTMMMDKLPFGIRAAQEFMRIAKCKRLAEAHDRACLPQAKDTLHEMACMNAAEWRKAEKAGLIRADVKRKEVSTFRRSLVTPEPVKALRTPLLQQPPTIDLTPTTAPETETYHDPDEYTPEEIALQEIEEAVEGIVLEVEVTGAEIRSLLAGTHYSKFKVDNFSTAQRAQIVKVMHETVAALTAAIEKIEP